VYQGDVKEMKFVTLNQDKSHEMVKLWNDELGNHYPMREELFQQNSFDDHNVWFPASFIAMDEEKNKIIGFVISKIWQETLEGVSLGEGVGWIQSMLVDSSCRNHGVGSTLLQKAEGAFKKKGVQKVLLGRDPGHYFPGIPQEYPEVQEWFTNRGYSYSKTVYDLISNPNKLHEEEWLPQFEDVTFRLLDQDEGDKFIHFLHLSFPGRWEYEAIHYFQRGGTGREFVVLEKGDRFVGFCRLNDSKSPLIAQNVYWAPLFNSELGGIGPLGIDRKFRKRGYGLAIVQAAIYFLQQRGIKDIVIDWTELVDFYAKLGFDVWKSYGQYEKQL
jgi:GNAT superfamily N-acetyltransferase